jgi:hypothetical protein
MDSVSCTLIIPAAGDSIRFRHKTSTPKGLVRFSWNGEEKTMIEHVVPRNWEGPIIVATKWEDEVAFMRALPKRFDVIGMAPTSGQAETILNATFFVKGTGDVLVVNSDNAFRDGVLMDFVGTCRANDCSVGALTFRPKTDFTRYGYVDNHPKFYTGAEKVPISKHALAGAFYFRSASFITKYVRDYTASYVSEWFVALPHLKLSVEIPCEDLHEWGTAESLEDDVGPINWER